MGSLSPFRQTATATRAEKSREWTHSPVRETGLQALPYHCLTRSVVVDARVPDWLKQTLARARPRHGVFGRRR